MTDLISRAEAISAICEDGTKLEQQGRYIMSMSRRKQRDADILSALPTVDAVPVVHGRWKAVTEDMVTYKRICSCCGKEAPFDESEDVYLLYPHCPWCGASLDIKGGNGNGL